VNICDVTIRWIPRSIWWRIFIEITARRGSFQNGNGYSYQGLIYRRAMRIGPVNVALLRLR
jgi:hypothetical protein